MKKLPSTGRHTLSAQDIYFEFSTASRQNWCMTVFCTTLLLTTVLACFLPATLPMKTASAASSHTFTVRPHLRPIQHKQVFFQGQSQYHWYFRCPLVNRRSLRPVPADKTVKRIYLTEQAAQQKKLAPCYFCLESEQ